MPQLDLTAYFDDKFTAAHNSIHQNYRSLNTTSPSVLDESLINEVIIPAIKDQSKRFKLVVARQVY